MRYRSRPLRITVRTETPADYARITEVHTAAFRRANEGRLVKKLRSNQRFVPELSLVSEYNSSIIGHVLFFPIFITTGTKSYESLGLAPVAVLPEYQRKGVGSTLIKKGLASAKRLGYDAVIVLGFPSYYGRFGFKPASNWGIKPPFEIPDEVFLAMELRKDGLHDRSGAVEYPEEFNDV